MVSLIVFGIVVFAIAYGGSRFKPDAWHAALAKPAWNPPDWVFAPVWTVLYVAIAVAGWLVWRTAGNEWSPALTFWSLQLASNGAWTWLFFGRHRIDLALIDIGVTLIFIVGFMMVASSLSPVASVLFLPYAAWTLFAGALNAAIWRLNPSEPRPTTQEG
jgi:translocator protein